MKTLLAAVLCAAAFGATAQADNTSSSSVRFAFDKSDLPVDVATQLAPIVSYASAHPGTRVVLDAHCDPTGTQAYNVGLAIRRAEAVRSALTQAGVDDSQVVIAVFGEGGATGDNANDRRVDVKLSTDAIAEVIDQTYAGHGTAVRWEKPLTQAQVETPVQGDNVATR